MLLQAAQRNSALSRLQTESKNKTMAQIAGSGLEKGVAIFSIF
jgi:hypothetical protein